MVVPAPLILLLGLIADGSGNPARDVLLALSFTATLGLSAGLLCGISMGNYDRPVLAGILSGIGALLATVACVVGLADTGAGWFLLPVQASGDPRTPELKWVRKYARVWI